MFAREFEEKSRKNRGNKQTGGRRRAAGNDQELSRKETKRASKLRSRQTNKQANKHIGKHMKTNDANKKTYGMQSGPKRKIRVKSRNMGLLMRRWLSLHAVWRAARRWLNLLLYGI